MDYFKDKLFRCFNQDLKWHLLKNECRFLLVALDANSGDKFWLFERTPQFEKVLLDYKNKGKVQLSNEKKKEDKEIIL